MAVVNQEPVLFPRSIRENITYGCDFQPSNDEVAAAAKAEPGSKKELTFVKNVNTRFGRPQTTGIAVIYGDAESATVEPDFVHNRHNAIHSPGDSQEPAAPEPVAEESASEEDEADSEEGGDE